MDTDRVFVSHMTNGNVITGMNTVTSFDPAADGDNLNIADLLIDEPLLDHYMAALLAVALDGPASVSRPVQMQQLRFIVTARCRWSNFRLAL